MSKRKLETIEDYQAYVLELEQHKTDITLAKEGLETKLSEVEKSSTEYQEEIARLKIKNYEYFEQISLGAKNDDNLENKEGGQEPEAPSLDDLINNM